MIYKRLRASDRAPEGWRSVVKQPDSISEPVVSSSLSSGCSPKPGEEGLGTGGVKGLGRKALGLAGWVKGLGRKEGLFPPKKGIIVCNK